MKWFFALLLSIGSAVPAAAEEENLEILCQRFISAESAPDIAYQAGVDVAGKQVVPADLTQPAIIDAAEIPIKIELDAQNLARLGLKEKVNHYGELSLGEIELKEGKIYYEGRLLSNQEEDNLRVLCLQTQE